MDAMKRQLELILVENLLLCLCLGIEVWQNEKFLSAPAGQNVAMSCRHNDQSYITMLWYQQKKEGGMKLVAYSTGKDHYEIEDKENQNKWLLERPDILLSNLTIRNAGVQDSAVYFCASSKEGGNERQYFGSGTILAILGENEKQKPPSISIYRPSKRELEVQNFISLVCVASNFFPEHVKIRWFVNYAERINLYEPVPQRMSNNSAYSTSKRLTLTREEYFNPDSRFRCNAAFLDGNYSVSEEIKGETDCGISNESYTMYINQGKISYIMVLCKSGLYALVVLVLVWRKKVVASSY